MDTGRLIDLHAILEEQLVFINMQIFNNDAFTLFREKYELPP